MSSLSRLVALLFALGAWALAAHASADPIDTLSPELRRPVRWLASPDPGIRRQGLVTLERLERPREGTLLGPPTGRIQETAPWLLELVTRVAQSRAHPSAPSRPDAEGAATLLALLDLDAEACAQLVEESHEPDALARRHAVTALAGCAGGPGAAPAVGALADALNDPEEGVRGPAAESLSSFGAGALPRLEEALGAELPTTRAAALLALSPIAEADLAATLPQLVLPASDAAPAGLGPEDWSARFVPLASDADPRVRAAALRALGSFPTALSVDLLLDGLEDANAELRRAAAGGWLVASAISLEAPSPGDARLSKPLEAWLTELLAALRAASTVERVSALTAHEDGAVAQVAAQTLGRLGPAGERAAEPLLLHPDIQMRLAADTDRARGLRSPEPDTNDDRVKARRADLRRWESELSGARVFSEGREAAQRLAGARGRAATRALARGFVELGVPELRRQVSSDLRARDDASVPILVAALNEQARTAVDRAQIASALPATADAQAVEALTPLVSSGSPVLRDAAFETLVRIGSTEAVRPVLAAGESADPELRLAAVQALARLSRDSPSSADATRLQVAGLADRSPQVRVIARSGLESRSDPAAIPGLVEHLDSLDPRIRDSAADLLAQLGDARAVPPLRLALEEGEARAALRLLELGETEAVVDCLRRCEPAGREASLTALEGAPAERLAPFADALRDLMRGPADILLRLQALPLVARAGGPGAGEALAVALSDPDRGLRLAAARAAGESPALGDAVREVLGDALNDPAEVVAETAAEALLAVSHSSSAAAWREALPRVSRPTVQERAVTGLAELLGPAAADELIRALDSPTPPVRARAASALGSLRVPEALPALRPLTESDDLVLARAARRAVGFLEAGLSAGARSR